MNCSERMSKILKKEYIRDGRAPIPVKERTSRTMSAIRAKNTKPEIILRKALLENNLRGYRLHPSNIPGRPDICYPKKKIAIFVHGCFWHKCPHCKPRTPRSHVLFWKNKFRANINRDKMKLRELKNSGWRTMVIWECQINNELKKHIEIIKNFKN